MFYIGQNLKQVHVIYFFRDLLFKFDFHWDKEMFYLNTSSKEKLWLNKSQEKYISPALDIDIKKSYF